MISVDDGNDWVGVLGGLGTARLRGENRGNGA